MFSKRFFARMCARGCIALLCGMSFGGILTLNPEPAAAVDMRDLIGEWSIPDTNERLIIRRNGDWNHPKYGRGKIRLGADASDIAVFYEAIETKCSYRVSVADGGSTLILTTADTRQDRDRCPTGQFKSVDR